MLELTGLQGTYTLTTGVPFAIGRSSILLEGLNSKGTEVAVKVFRSMPTRGRGLSGETEFLNEIKAQRALQHPHVLPILDFGVASWAEYGPFVVLPKCGAGNLRAIMMTKDFMPLSQTLEILSPLASAIDYAHCNGVIHGDIKPENILFTKHLSQPYLADFGVAKYFPVQERITTAAEGDAGSSAYMSPEQVELGIQSPRSDIYSLAVLAFEMLTGSLPFDVSVTTFQQMTAKIAGQLIPAQTLNHLISDETQRGLNWGLRTDRSQRPASATELVAALSLDDKHQIPLPSDKSAKNAPQGRIFVSYSHQDEKWLQKLSTVLKPLTRDSQIRLWSDHMIRAGSDWKGEIGSALKSARAAVLLVSQNFLASDFIFEKELLPLLTAARSSGTQILWIAVSACLYQVVGLAEFQSINDPSKPLDSLSRPALNRELVRIAEKIKHAVQGTAT